MLSSDGLHRSATDGVALGWSRRRTVRSRPRPAGGIRVMGPEAQAQRAQQAQRGLNVTVALIGLIALAPLMLVIAAVIRLTSPGPVFYTQPRVGIDRRTGSGGNYRRRVDYGGKLFTIYKFRTMTVGGNDQVWAQRNDPRVTPVGRVLRKTRLDELPQLVNVLKGEMNVVGPRPEQPKIFMELRERIERYPERQRVLPGITGWAQVNQHYDQDLDDVRRKVQLDLEYAARMSAAEDLKIMLRTVPVILFRTGGW